MAVLTILAIGCTATKEQSPTATDAAIQAATTGEPVSAGPIEASSEAMSLARLSTFPVEDFRVFETARQLLISKCMSDRGLDYSIPPIDPTSNLGAIAELYPPDELVQQYGYTWRMHYTAFTPPNDQVNGERMEDPAYEDAFNQCGESTVEILDIRPYAEAMQIIDNARQEISTQVEADSRYVDHLILWAGCMTALGYELFGSPVEAMRSVTSDPLSPMSIQLALSDYSCQREVGLAETAEAILSELSQDWIDQNPGAVAAVNEERQQLVDAAEAILDSAH